MVDAEAWDHGVAFLPNPVHQSVFVACGFSVNSAVFANRFPVAFHRERAGVRGLAEPLSAHTWDATQGASCGCGHRDSAYPGRDGAALSLHEETSSVASAQLAK